VCMQFKRVADTVTESRLAACREKEECACKGRYVQCNTPFPPCSQVHTLVCFAMAHAARIRVIQTSNAPAWQLRFSVAVKFSSTARCCNARQPHVPRVSEHTWALKLLLFTAVRGRKMQ
jgi:hypothetical protein